MQKIATAFNYSVVDKRDIARQDRIAESDWREEKAAQIDRATLILSPSMQRNGRWAIEYAVLI